MSKILWNSVLSTADAPYATLDIANFYLGTALDRYDTHEDAVKYLPPAIRGMCGEHFI